MSASPYRPDDLASARYVVTHADRLACLTEVERADILALALTILRKDRALRLNLQDHRAEAVIVRIPRAVFQAGPRGRRLPALHRIVLPVSPTPGDAA